MPSQPSSALNGPDAEVSSVLPRLPARVILLTVALAGLSTEASSQTEPTLTLGGEIRPRLLARRPIQDQWDHWVSMRTRLSLDGRFQDGVGFFVQVQDVRFWGEETSSRDTDADAVDFYQAFIEVDDLPGIGGNLRGGRQEVDLGQGRFIAAPNWGQGGQAFDGIRWTRPLGKGHVDLVYLRLREGSTDVHEQSADFSAAWFVLPIGSFGTVDFLAIHDRYRESLDTDRTTLSSTWKHSEGALSFRLQGAYQTGERQGQDVSAFLLAAQGTAEVVDDLAMVSLWYDHLSGDDDPTDGDDEAFSNLFSARHRFYGRADYFRRIPEDLDGLGLRDLALKLTLTPEPDLFIGLDVHTFRTAKSGTLGDNHLAEEIDLWARHRFRNALDLQAGYFITFGGQAMKELGLLDGTGHTLYFMTSLAF